MNPEKELTPREQLEARLTSLLMGELPPAEEKSLQAQIAADPELAALHGRLRKALELLREAKAFPDHPVPLTPLQLSSERRERLLAHFKTPAPAPSSAPTPAPIATLPRRDWSWAVPMGIAAGLIALLGAGLLINSTVVVRKSFSDISDPQASTYRGLRIFNGQEEVVSTTFPGTVNNRSGSGRNDKTPPKTIVAMRSISPPPPDKESYGRYENRAGMVTAPAVKLTLAGASTLDGPTASAPLTLNPPISAEKSLASNSLNRIYFGGQTVLTPVPAPSGDSFSLESRDAESSAGTPGKIHASYGNAKSTITIPKIGTGASADSLSAQNESQRYPGHPATTSLGAVFESNLGSENLYTGGQAVPLPIPGLRGSLLSEDGAPKISAGTGSGFNSVPSVSSADTPNSSMGGTVRLQESIAPTISLKGGRLYGSLDDMLFNESFSADPKKKAPITVTAGGGTLSVSPATTAYPSPGDFDIGLGAFPDGPFAGKQDGSDSIFKYWNVTPGITGNTRTRDNVIRRELLPGTADPFDTIQVDAGKQTLKQVTELEPKRLHLPPGTAVFNGGGTAGTAPALNAADFPFVAPGASPGGAANAAGTTTSGNRSGNLGISANAIDALLFPTTKTGASTPASSEIAGAGDGSNAPAFDPAPPKPEADGPVRSKGSATVEQVKQLFIEAQGFYDTGRYDLAKKRSEQILNIDHYNIAARRIEERADEKMSDYGVAANNQTRATAISETDRAWQRSLRRFNTAMGDVAENDSQAASTKKLRQKLEHIIIPKIDFHETTVRDAIDFLKKKSVELDDSSPAGEKGANIVLKLAPAAGTVTQGVTAPGIPRIPGLDTPAPAAAAPAAAPAAGVGNPQDARITVSLTNIPLIEALKYVTGLASMKFKVEPHAISVVPLSESTDVLITKEWKIPPDLIPRAPEARGAGNRPKGTSGIADQESAKNWLAANGVTFNGAASAIYIPRSHRLIVRDTEDQLDLVDTILDFSPSPQASAQSKIKQDVPVKEAAPDAAIPQPEIQTSINAFSTFSLNVSDVSFKLAAASLEQGKMPQPSSVRSEEFINAFDYHDSAAAPGAPLAFATERARYPFAQNRDLLRFAVKTAAAGREPGRPLNIVLLLDKSGSMERADRVNIVREALRVLTAQLQPQDKLSIVTFARTPRLWADGVAGDKAGEIIARVGEITPEGGTNLEAALDLGYATALRHYAVGNISRVILFTDGAANLGDVNPEALQQKVEAYRKKGVALDCFGIGWEGYNDDLLEELTRHGDGRYGFINTPEEATANFATQLAGALHVAAADVKVQVEFNPRRVTAYRQIGYAKHQLTKEQFRDNTVDAAEIGAEESGNALYVVEVNPKGEGDLATVRVRFKVPGTSDYREHEWAVPFTGNAGPLEQASPALRLAGTAAAFSEMLADNPYAGEVTDDRLLGLINGVPAIYSTDPRPAKLEWMIRQAKSLSGR